MPIRFSIRLGAWLTLTSAMLAAQPFPDAHEKPIPEWKDRPVKDRPVFRLRQDYPTQRPAPGPLPWSGIRFKDDPEGYMKAVLEYAFDGNTEVDWVVQDNTVRNWYHAPWLHWGEGGREFVHGMTRERHSRPKELGAAQVSEFQTWAVSVYNEPGGYTIGRVWANPAAPNPAAADFPDGTVAVKLLFTDATLAEVPYLEGSKEWDAYVASRSEARAIKTMRLLQVDFAVRDPNANCTTGWVFGTFQYHRDKAGATPWERLVPVSLTWGNDPGLTPQDLASGRKLEQSWTNPEAPIVRYRRDVLDLPLGWAGRANGPVDNPTSSCLSCHATAQYPATVQLAPARDLPAKDRLPWFRNLKPGESLDPEVAQGLDYSLQLSAGISNFYSWLDVVQNKGVVPIKPALSKPALLDSRARNNSRVKDDPILVYGVSREEDEQKAIRVLSEPREMQEQ